MTGLTAAAREGWAAENRAAAQRLVACYALLQECWREYGHGIDGSHEARPGHAVVDGLVAAAGYVVAAMSISARRAEKMLSFAWELHTRYPAILEAMAAGLMEQRVAELLARQMATVRGDVLEQVQRQVVEDYLNGVAAGIRLGDKALRDDIDAVIGRYDPDAIRLRKEDANRGRGVRIGKGVDGMSTVSALLATEEAAVLAEALDQRVADHDAADTAAAQAAAAARAGAPDTDPDTDTESAPVEPEPRYSKAERRADALMSLICGDTPTHPDTHPDTDTDTGTGTGTGTDSNAGPGDPSAATGGGQGLAPVLRPKVTVIATGDNGRDDHGARVEFTRTGQAALHTLMEMLATSDGASFEQVDPRLGAADDTSAALRYRPGAELARRVRLRDGTCRHPGCAVPADDCDLDHVVPFNHADPAAGGQTIEANLVSQCRRHHRFKTFSDWTYKLEPDGTLIVTTPDGTVMLTRPDGPLAQYRREHQRDEADAWARQQRRNPNPDTGAGILDEATYFARRAQRLARERARTAARNAADATSPPPETAADTTPGPAPRERMTHAAASRWWERNKPTDSTLEKAILHALHEHLDELLQPPPPF
ncbi:HNH endonuclease signature motif containing protein [Dietzia cinnamea]|uniref:HNH endonuclease signature motif containing protein n=1 Tax=Dietzia cinnamea TaxID=321318 RepID=UPI0021A7D414|nr:HNH endonuclease signature motif containing protein [Dietzia cinnamea]MCT2274079.1 HNH endonuclease [Dietzia cinnamea]